MVYSAGVGTEQGAPVLDVDLATGASTPRLGPDGVPVITRLDPLALRLIAESGGGEYIELSGGGRPLTSLAAGLDSLDATTFSSQLRPQPIDRHQVFAWVALAVLLVATLLLPLAQWVRRRSRARGIAWRQLWPLAGAGLLIGAVCASDAASTNRRGNEQYAGGDYASSVDTYRTAEALDPGTKALFYNASNALNRAERLNEAIDEAKRALPAHDESLTAKIEYALGNHYAASTRLVEALEAYKRSLLADPHDEDAKHNLEVIASMLAETPSPTPTPTQPPLELTPTPGGGDDSQGGNGQGTATAGPGDNGTPGAGGTPGAAQDGQMNPAEVQRALDEALRGIDQDFTVDEALRVLDLLGQQNREQLQQGGESEPGAPDY
jgi:tetratricopeptide (TPR) repeat protein